MENLNNEILEIYANWSCVSDYMKYDTSCTGDRESHGGGGGGCGGGGGGCGGGGGGCGGCGSRLLGEEIKY